MRTICALTFALLLSIPATARAEGRHDVALETGIGLTTGPTTFLLTAGLPIGIARDVAVGPMMQLGVGDDDQLIFSPTLDVRYAPPLSRFVRNEDSIWSRIRPLGHAGAGLAYLRRNHSFRNDEDLGFLVNFGLGLEFYATDQLFFGTRMTLNVMPGEVLGETFFLSWQLAQLKFRF